MNAVLTTKLNVIYCTFVKSSNSCDTQQGVDRITHLKKVGLILPLLDDPQNTEISKN